MIKVLKKPPSGERLTLFLAAGAILLVAVAATLLLLEGPVPASEPGTIPAWLQKKKDFFEQAAKRQAALRASTPQVPKSLIRPPISSPMGTEHEQANPPAGISSYNCAGGFPSSVFLGINSWRGEVQGHWVAVCAGTYGIETPNFQGGVYVIIDSRKISWHPAPIKAGSLFVVSASGTLLTLSSVDGERFSFDAATLKYVSRR